MRAFVHPDEMSRIDSETMRQRQMSSFQLMSEVSREMANRLLARSEEGDSFLFLVAGGQNSGDGYCVSEILRKEGRNCFLLPLKEPESEDCLKAARKAKSQKLSEWPSMKTTFIVDALVGNQSKAKLNSAWEKVLSRANRSKSFRVSLDCPTGIDTHSGQVAQEAFRADLSLCVAYPRRVFCLEKVAERCGEIEFVGQNFASASSTDVQLIEFDQFPFFPRPKASFKRGRCGVLAGSASSPGAAFLCAEAAQRSGAGYSQLFFEKRKSLKIGFTNASFQYADNWKEVLSKPLDSLVVGCGGLPRSWKKIREVDCPQVFDAEALRQFSSKDFPPSDQRVLTPHWGEAKALLNLKTLKKDKREQVLFELVNRTGQAVVLKGAPSLVGFPSDLENQKLRKCYVNLSIQPGFATAGTGDVLSGILGGFLAQTKASFKETVLAALYFQKELGRCLQELPAALATDQLLLFSEVFRRIRSAD